MDADGEDTLARERRPRVAPPEGADLEETVLVEAPPTARIGATRPPPAPEGARAAPHRIRVGEEVVVLTVPVILGRSPGQPRIPTPVARVRVPSPSAGISANHLEVRQVGATVVVRDLRSTNGTTVHLPGRPGRRLGRDESIAVPAGTVLDLGEGVVVRVLGPADEPSGQGRA